MLRITRIDSFYGGVQVLRQVSLDLAPGEVLGLLGRNGAGKTTLVSVISGRIRPSNGRVAFKGRDITRLRDWERVNRGIVYTFQVTSIYRNLSCYENVALAAQRRLMGGPIDRIRLGEEGIAEAVEAALARVGLAGRMDRRADELPYGHQRLLEVAMGLALEPELLILDEPTQGLAQQEISEFCELIRSIAKAATVLLIEHNMSVVLELAETVTVMDQGEIIAEGTPAEIERHPEVQRAYLGT